MFWNEFDAREQVQRKAAAAHREALRLQLEDLKQRKKHQKLSELSDTQKLVFGQSALESFRDSTPASATLSGEDVGRLKQKYPLAEKTSLKPAVALPLNERLPPIANDIPVLPSVPLPPVEKDPSQIMLQSPMYSGQPPPPPVGDLAFRLRLAEEQLVSEKRSRSALESELAQQKNLLMTLTAQLSQFQRSISADNSTLHQLAKQMEQHDRKVDGFTQETVAKVKQHEQQLQQLTSDMEARQHLQAESHRVEESKVKSLMEEVNTLKYKLEHFNLEANKADQELFLRTKELEDDHRTGSDIRKVLKDHDVALDMMQKNWNTRYDALDRKMEAALVELRKRMDAEAKARSVVEQRSQDLFADIKEYAQQQERDLTRFITNTKDQLVVATEAEMKALDSRIDGVYFQMQQVEKNMVDRDIHVQRLHEDSVSAFMQKMKEEQSERQQDLKRLRHEMEMMSRAVAVGHQKSVDILDQSMTTVKQDVYKAIKKTQESLALTERELSMKHKQLEEVLRAEIKSRMESEARMKDAFTQRMDQALDSVNANLDSRSKTLVATQQSMAIKLETDVRTMLQQALEDLQTGSLRQLDNELQAAKKRIQDVELSFAEKITESSNHLVEQWRLAYADEAAAREKLSEENYSKMVHQLSEGFYSRLSENDAKMNALKHNLDERLALRQRQMDMALAALKESIDHRVPKSEFEKQVTTLTSELSTKTQALKDRTQAIQVQMERQLSDEAEFRASQAGRMKELLLFKEQADKDLFRCVEWQKTFDTRLETLGTAITGDVGVRLADNEGKLGQVSRTLGDDLKPVVETLAIQVTELRNQLSQRVSVDRWEKLDQETSVQLALIIKQNTELQKEVESMTARLQKLDEVNWNRQQQLHHSQEQEIEDNWRHMKTWHDTSKQRLEALEKQLLRVFDHQQKQSSEKPRDEVAVMNAALEHHVKKLEYEVDSVIQQTSRLAEDNAGRIFALERRLNRMTEAQQERNFSPLTIHTELQAEMNDVASNVATVCPSPMPSMMSSHAEREDSPEQASTPLANIAEEMKMMSDSIADLLQVAGKLSQDIHDDDRSIDLRSSISQRDDNETVMSLPASSTFVDVAESTAQKVPSLNQEHRESSPNDMKRNGSHRNLDNDGGKLVSVTLRQSSARVTPVAQYTESIRSESVSPVALSPELRPEDLSDTPTEALTSPLSSMMEADSPVLPSNLMMQSPSDDLAQPAEAVAADNASLRSAEQELQREPSPEDEPQEDAYLVMADLTQPIAPRTPSLNATESQDQLQDVNNQIQ